MSKSETVKPFLKWAGGKSRMIPHLTDLFPITPFNYYEPFLGGGAVFFYLSSRNLIKEAYLNDSNEELIVTYEVIKYNLDLLLQEILKPLYKNEERSFYDIRSLSRDSLNDIEVAARFIFLNKTCFNGLYRVNKSGKFNVPYGKYVDPLIVSSDNLKKVSKSLEKAKLTTTDFKQAVVSSRMGDVIYFDPPYLPISKSAKFTNYTSGGFHQKDHAELKDLFTDLNSRGIKCLLSNSASEESISLYSDCKVTMLMGNRSIGGSPDSRKSMKEILVTG